MAKVTVGGEVYSFDPAYKPMSEALMAGSARSLAGFVWLVWKRNGRDVPLADILSGAVDVDLNTLEIEGGDDEAEAGEVGPTTPTPEASSTTAAVTSASSRKSSGSSPGRSRS